MYGRVMNTNDLKVKALEVKNKELEKELQDRFDEIAVLTNMLQEVKEKIDYRAIISNLKNDLNKLRNELEYKNSLIYDIREEKSTITFRRRKSLIQYFKNKRNIYLLKNSGMFDSEWYLLNYQDVAKDSYYQKKPLEHFLIHGAYDMRNPSNRFDTEFYIKEYPDVASSNLNPLLHYVLFGNKEGRKCLP